MASSRASTVISQTDLEPGSVKICGTRTVEDAMVASVAGAELIGMIFAPARRQVTIETARQISDAVHVAAPGILIVGVFVDAPAEEINASAEAAGLDLVQLHGDEPPEFLAGLDRPAIKAIRAFPTEDADTLASRIRPYLSATIPPIAILIDGYDPAAHGGTGVRADWGLVRDVSDQLEIAVSLAGGLTPDNVSGAIGKVRPLMVDISSGVEVDGVKDSALIRQFVASADAAFRHPTNDPSGSRP